MKFGEIYEKYGKRNIIFPFRECYFCEGIEDCPHPEISDGHAIPPDECVRKDDIILEKR